MRFSYILLPIFGAIICFATAVILRICGQRSLSGRKRVDLFDNILSKFNEHLKKHGNSLALNTYVAVGLLGFTGMVLLLFMTGQSLFISL